MINFKEILKKCPFCGCSAYLRKSLAAFGEVGYYVKCNSCDARTYVLSPANNYTEIKDGKVTGKLITRDDKNIINSLIEKWNKRVSEE